MIFSRPIILLSLNRKFSQAEGLVLTFLDLMFICCSLESGNKYNKFFRWAIFGVLPGPLQEQETMPDEIGWH
jgi:hypothetical protein